MRKRNKGAGTKSYAVGYGKPPAHSQFKKGESGNYRGRPSGTLNFATVLLRTLREQVVINENGQRKTITKLEAALKQLANKAASGELRALQLLLALVRSAEEQSGVPESPKQPLEENDKKVMEEIVRRFENSLKGGTQK